MSAESCPNRESLLQYSLGNLSEERLEELAAHLNSCGDCQATVMSLEDVEDTLIERLRASCSDEFNLAEPEFLAAVEEVLTIPAESRGRGGGEISPDFLDGEFKLETPAPKMLGEYQILEALGHGGMGRVYKALHTKLDRVVAVKILSRNRLEDRQAIHRFEREMRAVGKLSHPHIVQAYDAREIEGTPVLVMEFVDGLDLSEIVRRAGALPIAEACELVRQTALALQCAHEHGLVHRDIKPSNIMLNRSGEVKLLDLGLARFYADTSVGEEMTGTGQAMGTADYIAPEQAADSRNVDIRSDLYSLGCTLFKLLSGRVPFSGPEYRGVFDKMNAHVNKPPPSLRQSVPSLPEELSAIVGRLLAKDPGERFAVPAELVKTLEPFSKGADLQDLVGRAVLIPRELSAKEENNATPHALQEEAPTKVEPIQATSLAGTEPASLREKNRWLWLSLGFAAIVASLAAGFLLGIQFRVKKDGKESSVAVEIYGKTEPDSTASQKSENPFEKYLDQPSLPTPLPKGPGSAKETAVLPKGEGSGVKYSSAPPKAEANDEFSRPSAHAKELADLPDDSVDQESLPSGDRPKMLKVDWSQAKTVLLLAPHTEWHVDSASVAPIEPPPKSVPLPSKANFFERMNGMAVSRVAKTAVVVYELRTPGNWEKATTRVVLCDFVNGQTTDSGSASGEMFPLALHDDGRRILLHRGDFGRPNADRLEIWAVKDHQVVRELAWMPYGEDRFMGTDVTWAEFVDTTKLATCSRGGKVALWEFESRKPLCHFQIGNGALPALSPDRKWLAFASNDTVGVFDIEKQAVIASQATPCTLQMPKMAISPSGSKIGCVALNRILVWDMASGKLEKNFTLPGISSYNGIAFPGENFILANNQTLIELENRVQLWRYQGADEVRMLGETAIFATGDHEEEGVLLAAKVPHAEAISLLKMALAQPDLFVFHKGTPVKLDVSGIPETERESVKATLTKKLQEMDCAVEETAQVEVVALVEGPKKKAVSFTHSGTYQVQENWTRLKIVHEGMTAWETSATNIPSIPQVRPGENLEGVLREASEHPSYDLFERVALPEYVQKPSEKKKAGGEQTLGASRVTLQGFRDF